MVRRLTTEEYKKRVLDKFGPEYEVIGEYTVNTANLTFKHICGNVFQQSAANFLTGKGCIKCHRHDKFIDKVRNKAGEDFQVLGRYTGEEDKIRIKHTTCGYSRKVKPKQFFANKYFCPWCAGFVSELTLEDIEYNLYEKYGEEYELVGEYFNFREKTEFKHIICNHKFYATPRTMVELDTGCPRCREIKDQKERANKFKRDVLNLKGPEYRVHDDYIKYGQRVTMEHTECGNIWETTIDSYLRSEGKCPRCDRYEYLTPDTYRERVHEVRGNEYTVLGDFKDKLTKLLIRHNTCNHEWEVYPGNFLYKVTGCPECSMSHGEELVSNILTSLGETFEYQKTFKGLKDVRSLRVDFYLTKRNYVIEYDGEQHYGPVAFGGITEEQAKDNFKDTVRKDKIKNKYMKTNGISYTRIPYYLKPEEVKEEIINVIKNNQEVTQRTSTKIEVKI